MSCVIRDPNVHALIFWVADLIDSGCPHSRALAAQLLVVVFGLDSATTHRVLNQEARITCHDGLLVVTDKERRR